MSTSREDFVERLGERQREAALAVLRAAATAGFAAAFRTSATKAWASVALEGIRGNPVTLDQDFLWVSLGRHHPALRGPTASQEVRRGILRVSPTTKQAENPNKGEAGIALDSITAEGRGELGALFAVLRQALLAA